MTPERWRKVFDLADAASALPAKERPSFLDRVCGADQELRSEIGSLLLSDEQANSFIEEPVAQALTGMLAGQREGPAKGDEFGQYRILDLIGAGGMGEVYLALDTRLDRKVALKFLSADFTNDSGRVRRFQREARAASALSHPNIVTIYDTGQVGSTYFIAAEFVDGRTLREYMAGRQIPVSITIGIGAQIAGALAAAHDAGIIHRDIKPENVVVRPDGLVKVLDFGLAKLAERSSPDSGGSSSRSKFDTEPGLIMGTPRYMSPEQIRGLDVDNRADLFSLGAVLYEMLTGKVPFDGPTTSDVIAAVLMKEAEPLEQSMPGATVELQNVIAKALDKQRDQRYGTARELQEDLMALPQQPDQERPGHHLALARAYASGAERLSGSLVGGNRNSSASANVRAASNRSHATLLFRRYWRVASVILIALLVPIGVLEYRSFVGRGPIDSVAILPLEVSGSDPETEQLGDGFVDSLITDLSRLPGLKVAARTSAFYYKGRAISVTQVGKELGVSGIVTGRIARKGDGLSISVDLIDARNGRRLWAEHYERQEAALSDLQSTVRKEISDRLRLKIDFEQRSRMGRFDATSNEAFLHYIRGRYFWANRNKENIHKAMDQFTRAIEADPAFAKAYAGLADCYVLLTTVAYDDPMPTAEAMGKARAAALRALEIDASLGEAHASIAAVDLRYDWNWRECEDQLREAIRLDPNYAPAHVWYSQLLSVLRKDDQALKEALSAKSLDPFSESVDMNLGSEYYLVGNYSVAAALFSEELKANQAKADANNAGQSLEAARYQLALTYLQSGRVEEAVALLEKVAASNELLAAGPLGYAYAKVGRARDARQLISRLTSHPKGGNALPQERALIYIGLGDRETAFELLRQSCREHFASFPFLLTDPLLTSIESDQRYQELCACAGVPPG